jgi:SnoaL-like domain
MSHAEDLARRYIHIWNETDPAARRTQLAGLWIEDATHYVRAREVRGHADLEARVATSHQTNVAERNYKFEVAGLVEQLRDMVKFNWRMVPKSGGAVAATGLIVLLLADDGRIRIDYQFIDPD